MRRRENCFIPEIRSVRTRVIDAAGEILAAHGVEDLSLRAIADRAGIGIASMYHYFSNKDELLLHLALRGYDQLRSEILRQQVDPENGSPMRGGEQAFIDFAKAQPALFSLMFSEPFMARHEVLRAAEQKCLEAYETAVCSDSRIPPEHRICAAFALWALGRGTARMVSAQPVANIAAELNRRLSAGASYLIERPRGAATVRAP